MANKIKLNVRQWLKIAARGLLVLIVLLILEVGVLYGAHFSSLFPRQDNLRERGKKKEKKEEGIAMNLC